MADDSPTQLTPVRIISDQPAGEQPSFDFSAYARTLAGLIANKGNATPLVIGVYGAWGSGKTTLMQATRRLLNDGTYARDSQFRPCKTVWFQAWKYAEQDEILAALIRVLLEAIRKDSNFITQLNGEIEKSVVKFDLFQGVLQLAQKFLGQDLSGFLHDLPHQGKIAFYDHFNEFFERLVWTYTRLRPKFTSDEQPDDSKGALVVFIDDLDRCPRSRIVQVLETIKLFMDKKGCVFVIGAAEPIIHAALKKHGDGQNAREFMDKIVQVRFNLPQLEIPAFEAYLETLKAHTAALLKDQDHLSLLVPTIGHNPRRFKRFLNDLHLLEGFHQAKGTGVKFRDLLYFKLLEFESPELMLHIRENPSVADILLGHINAFKNEHKENDQWLMPAETTEKIAQKSLISFLEKPRLVQLIHRAELDTKKARAMVSLVGVVETEAVMVEVTDSAKATDKADAEVIPASVASKPIAKRGKIDIEMVPVPAGAFKFGEMPEDRIIEVPYEIDIYPVTNRRFAAFVAAEGYSAVKCWTKQGLDWRKNNIKYAPEYWHTEKWNQPDHPVVGVSWFEADAYCRWLGQSLNDGYRYHLPDELQWERAARGTDGRQYPWGNEFDPERCNTRESGIGTTSRVTRYPNGISPVGCYDMAGNVWEWTSIQEQEGCVLRGGSWNFNREYARCASRDRYFPNERIVIFVGFRCARTRA